MRLTDTMRSAFVTAAMNDVPEVNYIEQIEKVALAKVVELLPVKVRAVWQDKAIRHHLSMMHVKAVEGEWSRHVYVEVPGVHDDDLRNKTAIKAACAELVGLHVAQRETRTELQAKLSSVARSCTTRKALAEALPEFEKYLPADESAANRRIPVVTGVVTAFMRAGWPKGQKQPAAKSPPKKAA